MPAEQACLMAPFRAAGDAALKEIVKRIHDALSRNCDWCARLGGDEFAVVLPHTDVAGACYMAERLRRVIDETPTRTGAGIVRMTVSVGAASLGAVADQNSMTAEGLIERADQSLYKSKSAGRNCVTA